MSSYKSTRGQARRQLLPDISLLAAPALKASSLNPPLAVLPEAAAASSRKRSDLAVAVPPRTSFSSFWSQLSPLPATACPTAEPGGDAADQPTGQITDSHAESVSSGEQYQSDESSEMVTPTLTISGSWQVFPLSVPSATLSSSLSPSSSSPSSLPSPYSATESASPPMSPPSPTTLLHANNPFAGESPCADSSDPHSASSLAVAKIRRARERERADRLELEVSALKAELAASREETRMKVEEYEAAIDALKASLARLMREHAEELEQLRALLEEAASAAKATLADEASSVEGVQPDCEEGGMGAADAKDMAGWHGDEADGRGCEGRTGGEDVEDEEGKEGSSMVEREKGSRETGADVRVVREWSDDGSTCSSMDGCKVEALSEAVVLIQGCEPAEKGEEWTKAHGSVEWLQQQLQESQARVAELEQEVVVLGERLLEARKRVTAGMVQMEMMSLGGGRTRLHTLPDLDAHAVETPDCDDDYDDGSTCDGADILCVQEIASATTSVATARADICLSMDSVSSQVDIEEDHVCRTDDQAKAIRAHAAVSSSADAHGSSSSLGPCEAVDVGASDSLGETAEGEEPASVLTERKVRFRECVEVFGSEGESLVCTEHMLLSEEGSWDWLDRKRTRDRQSEWWPTGQSVREQRKLTESVSDNGYAWRDLETQSEHGYDWEIGYATNDMLGEQRNGQQGKRREMLVEQMEAQVQCVEERLGEYCSDVAGHMKVDVQALALQLLYGMESWQGWKKKKGSAAVPMEARDTRACAAVSGADSAAAAIESCDEACTESGFVPRPLDVVAACVSEVMFEDFECDGFQRAAYCEFVTESERCACNYDRFLVQRWRRGPMHPLREPKFVSFCERKAERVADVLVGAMLALSPLPEKHAVSLSRSDSSGSNSTSSSSSSSDSFSMEDSTDRDSPLSGTTWATDTISSDEACHNGSNSCNSGNSGGDGGIDTILCGSDILSEKFVALARAVWALHALAWAFSEPARIYRLQPFSPFNSSFMRAVNREWIVHGALHKQHMAAFAILPAFVVGGVVLCGKVIITVQEKHRWLE
ncbi:hypothetical protein CLOP_g7665 [Closterium sp. NIES-67]|nr:hypothetical protein CLOP_g7665 [Closterium sp. NIES-67]